MSDGNMSDTVFPTNPPNNANFSVDAWWPVWMENTQSLELKLNFEHIC